MKLCSPQSIKNAPVAVLGDRSRRGRREEHFQISWDQGWTRYAETRFLLSCHLLWFKYNRRV